jgi:hypothetical protein
MMSWMVLQIACPGDLHDDPAPHPHLPDLVSCKASVISTRIDPRTSYGNNNKATASVKELAPILRAQNLKFRVERGSVRSTRGISSNFPPLNILIIFLYTSFL